jgi:hypothetical protein
MNGKRIIISPHARFEMRRRGIAPGEVMAAVRQPDQIVPSPKGREIRQSLLGQKGRLLLRVVVKETPVAYYVVTAYKTTKIAKYWLQS